MDAPNGALIQSERRRRAQGQVSTPSLFEMTGGCVQVQRFNVVAFCVLDLVVQLHDKTGAVKLQLVHVCE